MDWHEPAVVDGVVDGGRGDDGGGGAGRGHGDEGVAGLGVAADVAASAHLAVEIVLPEAAVVERGVVERVADAAVEGGGAVVAASTALTLPVVGGALDGLQVPAGALAFFD